MTAPPSNGNRQTNVALTFVFKDLIRLPTDSQRKGFAYFNVSHLSLLLGSSIASMCACAASRVK
jgi:hypothetical protein